MDPQAVTVRSLPGAMLARSSSGVMVIVLLGQFLLGIYVTLYVPMASITG